MSHDEGWKRYERLYMTREGGSLRGYMTREGKVRKIK